MTLKLKTKKGIKNKITSNQIKQNIPYYIMMLPGLIATFVFAYLPIFGIVIAFKKFNPREGILGSPWCGLDNFKFIFNSSDTMVVLRNTLCYNLVFIFLGLVLNVALAVLLNLVVNKTVSKIYQTIIIMPHFLSFVIVSYIVYAFLNSQAGFINNSLLKAFGMEGVNWYVTVKPWPFILTFVHFWKVTGYGSVVYLAAIAGIDTEIYEASEIDGANRWQQIMYVTIPSIKPVMITMTILSIGKIFNADFGLFYQVPMNSGALYSVTNVINTFVYNTLGQGGITGVGMSSAASFFQSVVGFVLVLITNSITRKLDSENAMF